MQQITSSADLAAWRVAHLDPERDRAPHQLRLRDLMLYRYLARRDARRYGWPIVDTEDAVVSLAWAHASRRHDERLARLTEVLESEVAPVRSFEAQLAGELAAQVGRVADAGRSLGDAPELEQDARGAGETQTDETVVRRRRKREHEAAMNQRRSELADAVQRRRELEGLLADTHHVLTERYDLHLRNIHSWWTYLGRIGEVVARGAARRHPNPTQASTLMRRLIAEAAPKLPGTHPWPTH